MGSDSFARTATSLLAACCLTLLQASDFASLQRVAGAEMESVLDYSQPASSLQPPSPEDDANDREPEPTEIPSPMPIPLEASPFLSDTRPVRIARAPNMLGDFFARSGTLLISAQAQGSSFGSNTVRGAVDFLTSGRMKVSDNNRAIATDRVFFMFSHFHNALRTDVDVSSTFGFPPTAKFNRKFSLDRYTFGFERILPGGRWSVEARLPFQGTFQFDTPNPPGSGVNVTGGKVGNLGVVLKREFPVSETLSVAAGLGLDLPTGSSFHGRAVAEDVFGFSFDNELKFTIRNQAVHLQPFVGLTATATDRLFFNAFLQFDFADKGQEVSVSGTSVGNAHTLGRFNEQNFMYLDVGAGYWFFNRPDANWLRGAAAIAELHYNTTLQDSDVVRGDFNDEVGPSDVSFENPFNRMDIVNVSMGLHVELARNTNLRAAAVAPLRDNAGDSFGRLLPGDRMFDAEFQVQINHRR